MAIEKREKTINGNKYLVISFGGMEGVRIKALLMKHVGPALLSLAAVAMASGKKKILEMDLDPHMIADLFEGMLKTMDENEYVKFILRLLANTWKKDIQITEEIFDAEFAGDYGTLYQVLFFVLEVNYKKSFFDSGGIGSLTKTIQNLVPPVKNFSKDSTEK